MNALGKFLLAAARLAKQGVKEGDILNQAKKEFGEVSEFMRAKIRKFYKDKDAPSIKNPSKDADIVPIKKDQASGIMKTDEASPLMKKMENVVDTLQKNPKRTGGGLDPATGLTRTLARRILDKKGIEIGKKDPINVFTDTFGESISDVNNLAEEMLEIDRRGGGMKDIDQMLEKDGLFDIKIPTNPQKGLSDDELIDLMRRVDEEERLQVLDDFDPTFRKPNAMGGRIGYADGPDDPKKIKKLIKKIPKVGKVVSGVESLVNLVNKKFGKGTAKTADGLESKSKPFDDFSTRNPDPKRELTDDEFQDLMEDVGDLDAYNFDGTIGSANRIRNEVKAYEADMLKQYEAAGGSKRAGGPKDPVAEAIDNVSPGFANDLKYDAQLVADDLAEKRFGKEFYDLDQNQQMDLYDEAYQALSTQRGAVLKKKRQSIIPKDEYAEYKKDFDKEILNKEIKAGVDDVMRDTSPAALQKSIEIDNLMLEYPGMSRDLAKQIANDPDPQRKAEVISMIEQTFKMSEKGMSGDEIIDAFKKGTDRTKQANGGLSYLMGM
tara:strand:- start:142 stop:1788 length:1647 start_codon:yes stop_codon:yes gene_type:complete